MRQVGDVLLLIICALAVGAALFGCMVFADRVLALTREQHLLVGGVVVYGATTLYVLHQQVLRRLPQPGKKLMAVGIAGSPIVLFLLLLNLGTIPWPTSMLPYVVATSVLTPAMIIAIERLFRRGGARP